MDQHPYGIPPAYKSPYDADYDHDYRRGNLPSIEESPMSYHSQSQLSSLPATPITPRLASSDQLLRHDGHGGYEWVSRGASDDSDNEQSPRRKKEATWPLGIKTGMFIVAAILVLNSAVTLWASLTFSVEGGLGTLHRGTCPSIEKIGFGLHILINVIGTLLLGASNYAMQCLTSPTRKEVDAQHARRRWLEVGILSVRNLKAIDRSRVWLWFFLGFSSFPIHLMFNSAVFVTLTANRYIVAAVTPEFVEGAPWSLVKGDPDHLEILAQIQANLSSYEKMSPEECIREYAIDFLSHRRHVVVVTTLNANEHDDNSLLGTLDWEYGKVQNSWVCYSTVDDDMRLHPMSIDNFDCSVEEALSADAMYIADEEVDYCLSERVPDVCRLQFSLPIMMIVIVCNTIKLICILLTLMRNQTTLITMGDAIDSFLRKPDPTTRGMCTMTMQDVKRGMWLLPPEPRMWAYKRYWRFQAVGMSRWISTNVFGVVSCALLGVLLYEATYYTTTNPDIHTWWSLGFGAITASSLIRWPTPMTGNTGLLKNVLLANLPQLLISSMYLAYNQVLTCMAFAGEYTHYFRHPTPLRVTRPRGLQRDSYFLTLPYRYILPLMTISATMHFVLSQGFFLVAVDVFDLRGEFDAEKAIMSVGFSISALVVLVVVCGVVVLVGFLIGLRRYPMGIPLVGPCSAGISAACHAEAGEDGGEVAEGRVQWGVVGVRNRVGHLGFSRGVVSPPVPGVYYAGEGGGDGCVEGDVDEERREKIE